MNVGRAIREQMREQRARDEMRLVWWLAGFTKVRDGWVLPRA